MRHASLLAAILVAAAVAPHAHADKPDTEGVTLTPSGEYTVRFRHFEGKDLVAGGVTNFARHRARVGLQFDYEKVVGAMFQVQDVRIWGEETDSAARDHGAETRLAPERVIQGGLPGQEAV